VLRDYGLPALFAPAMSISEFESLPALFTLSDVLLFWFVCRIAACLCMGAITLTLGRVFGNRSAENLPFAVGDARRRKQPLFPYVPTLCIPHVFTLRLIIPYHFMPAVSLRFPFSGTETETRTEKETL